MKVGIDARMYGPLVGGGGLGRYVEQLVLGLQEVDHKNRSVLFLKQENFDACPITNPNFTKTLADIHWYTLAEQVRLGSMMDAAGCDLIHFPHWNVPLFLKTPFVVTIHDLILLEEPRSAKATTRHPIVYRFKYELFKRVLAHAVRRAQHIIAVSAYTKGSILKHFPDVNPAKIEVVHEGVTTLKTPPRPPLARGGNAELLYIGNAYPHKNLSTLLRAFALLLKDHPNAHLTLAGRGDVFYERLQKELEELEELKVTKDNVTFAMNPTDEQVADLYAQATLFVLPSRIEGFGLTGLEAMSAGVPVAAARTGSLPEVLGDAAIYFDPNDPQDMAQTLSHLLADTAQRQTLMTKGTEQIRQFSWTKMAQNICKLYAR